MKCMSTKNSLLLIVTLFSFSCNVAPHNRSGDESELTVGTVQRSIEVGMSGAEVASALGSPNMVSTDEMRREVWVYDKVSTDSFSASGNGFVFLGIVGGGSNSRSSSTTQKTLTIIIKFDDQGKVRDFAYHSSKF